MILDTTTRTIEILLGAAVAANQLKCVSTWSDITSSTYAPGATPVATNNTTAVTAVAAPAAATQRKITSINVFNADTASAIVTVRLNDNGTIYVLTTISVPVNSSLQYTDTGGFSIVGGAGSSGLAGVNAQTGTTYTLALGDANFLVTMNNAAANTITVPPNSSVPIPVGTPVYFAQICAGVTTIAAGSGVTIQNASSSTCRARYAQLGCVKIATDTWLLFGDMQ